MEIRLFHQLSTRSKRAMLRRRGRFGRVYQYRPRRKLILRLAYENGMTESQVLKQLAIERKELLKQTF